MIPRLLVGIVIVATCSGCGRDVWLRCEDQERYLGSEQIAPIEIPDDLDAPDRSEALEVPQEAAAASGEGPDYGPCTESPPDFFEAEVPG